MTSLACCGRWLARLPGRLGHARIWRRLSWRRLSGHRTGRSLRRDLWALEGALEADAPKLASMFEIFNSLTRCERPGGIEPLASSAPLLTAGPPAPLMARGSRGSGGPGGPRGRRLVTIATLAVLAVVLAACLAISTQVHPDRSCLVASPAGLTGYRLSRVPGCAAYPGNK